MPEGVTAENPVKDGITYDTSVKTIKVNAEDNGNETLKVTYDGKESFTAPTFTNTYGAKGQAVLSAKKVLNGEKKLESGAYSFQLKEGDNVLQTKTNDANGNVVFDAIPYTGKGEHT